MGSLWANVNGSSIISGTITIPYKGIWCAEVVMTLGTEIATNCTLTVGDLSLVGYVVRTLDFANSRSVRIIGGYGGWRNQVTAKQYLYTGSIPLSMVLKDVAIEIGEKINIPTDILIGNQYIRQSGSAQKVINELYPNWWMGSDGVTQIVERSSSSIKTPFTVIGFSGAIGHTRIATENIKDWMPGRKYSNSVITTEQTISLTMINIEKNTGLVRLEILNV